MNLPDGTSFDFVQLAAPGLSHGFLICIAYQNLESEPAPVAPRLPNRGLALYTIRVPDLDAALARARAAGYAEIVGPLTLHVPGQDGRRYATVVSPSGVQFELFDLGAEPR